MTIDWAAGDWAAEVRPEVGGALSRLTWQGLDILRPMPAASDDALDSACFPLVAQANRIANGHFTFEGRDINLKPNLAGHPHWLHGQGWRRVWRIKDLDSGTLRLSFHYPGRDWPWAYESGLDIGLSEAGVAMRLGVTNRADTVMPAGLGFHPYFTDFGGAALKADVSGVWLTDANCLATDHVNTLSFGDWPRGAPLNSPGLIDHCHTGWRGGAVIVQPAQGFAAILDASPDLNHLHIYSPPGEPYFCVEPVSHRPNAINAANPLADGIRLLAPGETWSVRMTLRIKAI